LSLKILADEDVDYRIIKELRQKGVEVISILEENKGVSDTQVLNIAKRQEAILLTEDKDFGEWIFAHKQKEVSVILLRYNHIDLRYIINNLIDVLKKYESALQNKFVVISKNKVRIREI
jgi:predicted nuclease of predicted toxin-antitoxin system